MSKLNDLNIPTGFWITLGVAAIIAALFTPIAIAQIHTGDVQRTCIEQHGNWDNGKSQCTFSTNSDK